MLPQTVHAERLGVSYRQMTDADLPFIAELYASTRRNEIAHIGWSETMQAAFLAQQHEAQHRHYRLHFADAEWLIIEAGGKAIGRLYWRSEPADLYIIDISLVPARRGNGLGGAILQDLLEMARDAGRGVSIRVEKHNPARRLYARKGFALVEDQGVYDLMRAVLGQAPRGQRSTPGVS